MKAKDLRNSILQMAVQGKLVPQDPSDEPASALLERIRAERAKLIKEKKIKAPKGGESVIYRASDGSHYEKRSKGEPVCIDDEIPFDIPESWEWARFESLTSQIGDGLHGTPDFGDGAPYAFINGNNLVKGRIAVKPDTKRVSKEEYEKYRVALSDNALLLSINGTIGNVAYYNQEQVIFGKSACYIDVFSQMKREYIHLLISTRYFFEYATNAATQTTIKNVSLRAMRQLLVPVPPMAEQKRISDIYLLLAPFVAEYGALEDAREHLDAELPDRLRKSILQMAVQGKLVPQDPADEPASALLDRIRAERAALVKAKKLKAPKGGESVIYRASDGGYYEKRGKGEPQPLEAPFDVPDSWEWVRVSTVFNLVRGSGIKRTEVAVSGEPCVRYGELYTTYQTEISEVISYTTRDVFDKAQKLLNGEVVATLTGENDIDIGRSVVNNTGETIAFGGDLLALKGNYIDGEFAMLCMNSPYMGLQRTAAASGNIIVHLSADKIGGFLMAIPPANEQKRIVTRCKELLTAIG